MHKDLFDYTQTSDKKSPKIRHDQHDYKHWPRVEGSIPVRGNFFAEFILL